MRYRIMAEVKPDPTRPPTTALRLEQIDLTIDAESPADAANTVENQAERDGYRLTSLHVYERT